MFIFCIKCIHQHNSFLVNTSCHFRSPFFILLFYCPLLKTIHHLVFTFLLFFYFQLISLDSSVSFSSCFFDHTIYFADSSLLWSVFSPLFPCLLHLHIYILCIYCLYVQEMGGLHSTCYKQKEETKVKLCIFYKWIQNIVQSIFQGVRLKITSTVLLKGVNGKKYLLITYKH